ncbi:hypothetical protein AXF42_Ash001948 [Apostasia shenzhenica]|uniref:Retrotransposon gag domain-containing protein n=1 Tax=Apostasia shenzhenica TaxID=1088818 RepID=A0A2I0ABQ2_9ASPA|nr:hypothetical protein AXF42_Ash001948 [Apostasia shenzhenica]
MVVSDMVLANIKQGERENLRDYTNRFFAAAAEAEGVEPAVAMHNFRQGLKVGDLSKSLQLAKPRCYPDLIARASQFMLLEDAESSPTSAPGVKQERSKRKHRGAEPPTTRMRVAKHHEEEEGRNTSGIQNFSSPGRFLRSTRQLSNKAGSDLPDPVHLSRPMWIPTTIVSSMETTGTY